MDRPNYQISSISRKNQEFIRTRGRETMSEYTKQAQDFLDSTGTTIAIHKVPNSVASEPEWGGLHGYCYRVKLTRKNKQPYSFDFWDSYHNMLNHKKPTTYAILCCLDASIDTDMSIDEFAEEFGSNGPISQTIRVYNACLDQTRRLKELFSPEQLELLEEIR